MKTEHVPGCGRRAPAQGALRGAGPQDGVPELHSGPRQAPWVPGGFAGSAELHGPPAPQPLWFCRTVNLGRCLVSTTNR